MLLTKTSDAKVFPFYDHVMYKIGLSIGGMQALVNSNSLELGVPYNNIIAENNAYHFIL